LSLPLVPLWLSPIKTYPELQSVTYGVDRNNHEYARYLKGHGEPPVLLVLLLLLAFARENSVLQAIFVVTAAAVAVNSPDTLGRGRGPRLGSVLVKSGTRLATRVRTAGAPLSLGFRAFSEPSGSASLR